MKAETGSELQRKPQPQRSIAVTVNERLVNFSEHKVTGLEIKQAAIQQGIVIQEDFVLFEVKGNASLKQITDSETITLHPNQAFRAVAPDDNS